MKYASNSALVDLEKVQISPSWSREFGLFVCLFVSAFPEASLLFAAFFKELTLGRLLVHKYSLVGKYLW